MLCNQRGCSRTTEPSRVAGRILQYGWPSSYAYSLVGLCPDLLSHASSVVTKKLVPPPYPGFERTR